MGMTQLRLRPEHQGDVLVCIEGVEASHKVVLDSIHSSGSAEPPLEAMMPPPMLVSKVRTLMAKTGCTGLVVQLAAGVRLSPTDIEGWFQILD